MIKEKLQETILFTKKEEERFRKLQEKKQTKLFEVAFCGHFSAGKSTILNTLLGAEVLPTSPIPTSANIIEIKNGKQRLTVHAKNEEPKIWDGEIPWDKVRDFGMNGHEISKMTITAPLPFLGEHSCILDTPGVDSTDESHEAVTVEQLYTTDAICYVMDYNHVQSETNLYFLKQLSLEKKLIYIVINQIDKHNESEIPFSMFKKSMEDVFRSWGITYVALYFTSMKAKDHPLNSFSLFEKQLKGLLYQSNRLTEGSNQRLEEGFYQSIENRLQEEELEQKADIITEMKENGYSLEQLEEEQLLSNQLNQLVHYEEELRNQFETELGKLFKNVTLFPALTTDKARDWIDSLQPGFKVGLFFTKKKTEEEQAKRLEKLIQELQDKVKTQLLFHVQSHFQKVDRTELTNKDEFEEAFNALSYQVKEELLKSRVLTDHSSREYVYTFTGEITKVIVKEVKDRARNLLQLEIKGKKRSIDDEIKCLQEKLAKLEAIKSFSVKLNEVKQTYERALEKVRSIGKNLQVDQEYLHQIKEAMNSPYPELDRKVFQNIRFADASVIETDALQQTEKSQNDFSEEDSSRLLDNIKNTLLNFSSTSLLGNERNHLLNRIERYEKQTFIVSLFGAFSAGKSSFANALLGENVLPVSPNPTTATVSTVQRSTKANPHGTVIVKVKTRTNLNDEILAVADQLDVKVTIETIFSWKPNMKQFISSWQKTYAEYLLTLKSSLETINWKSGSDLVVSLDDLQSFVADESKACLIEQVFIYFDAPITEKGIVLVDTPGVNSIHGRHTNVAFQQMRSSDAIFYLTYYNHAFSKADQYFLQQMAKVNESFQHDKLYFVINASDLAANQGELNGVRKHVHEQLVRNQMSKPRLYDLSSREGLLAKKQGLNEETSFSLFEKAFYEHTILELKQLSIAMIETELRHFISKANDSLLFMTEEAAIKQKKHEQLKKVVENQINNIKNKSFSYAIRDVQSEFDQLTLYLRERMRYVLNDYFQTAINVSVLTGNSRKELQEQLIAQIKEWCSLGEFFLKQELEATIIRMEEAMKLRTHKWIIDEEKVIQKELPFLFVDQELEIKVQPISVHDLHLKVEATNYVSLIKSKKDFFENGMVKQLKDVLVTDGVEKASELIHECSKRYKESFEVQFQNLEKQAKERFNEAISLELQRFEALFDQKEQLQLQKETDQLQKYVL